jgi:pimeloyl-ACP methyl ester carboxylesterase
VATDPWAVRPGWRAIGVVAAVVLLALPALGFVGAGGARAGSPTARSLYPFTNVTYRSSVDRFPLSYDEWLPAGYTPNRSWPLAVFLHGIGNSTTPVRGGVNNFVQVLTTGTTEGATERALIENASLNGFIFLSLNTRSAAGFYVNTSCGGPQQQDVLDAIAHERALRNVSSVYLIGFSMGAIGALSLAGHLRGLVSGLALAAPASDMYEEYQYLLSGRGPAGIAQEISDDNCGVLPSPTNTSVDSHFFSYLSADRWAPLNFSSIPVWVSSGGLDVAIPNDARIWPFLQVNDSFLTSSCLSVPRLGESTGCNMSWLSLHTLNLSGFIFRDVYEPQAIHSISQLDPADIFAFWAGAVSGGVYHSTFPPTALVPGP